MATDYVPSRDSDFDAWLNQFSSALTNYATTLGFTTAETTQFADALTDWQGAYSNHLTAQNSARGARATKDNAREAMEQLVRPFARRIQSNPNTTDQMRAEFGITIADTIKTPVQPPEDAPNLDLDWSKRGQVTVHVGTTPANEQSNKFPTGVKFALIQWRIGEGEWQHAGLASSSPFVHVIGNTEPTTIHYRACYVNNRGEQGPWSEADEAYVASAA